MSDLAWHFLYTREGRPVLRDNRPAVFGEWLEHVGDVEICVSGLHASRRALDTLSYIEGSSLVACLVEVNDIVTERDDKLVCRRRRIVGWTPADETLRIFARHAALSVLHLWQGDAPAVVREYLETGDETIRAAAGAAAWDAARAAAWAAAWDAARDAARDAAWDAAGAAAWDAARAAAWAAAWDAARAAAWDAAGAAAWDAARAAAFADFSAELESMLLGEMERA